jgi:hypothetical protein
MNAPAILIPLALFGFALGWTSAGLVLRQTLATLRERIEQHRERAEFYKEKLPPPVASEPNPLPVYATRERPPVQHSVIARKLEDFYRDGTHDFTSGLGQAPLPTASADRSGQARSCETPCY